MDISVGVPLFFEIVHLCSRESREEYSAPVFKPEISDNIKNKRKVIVNKVMQVDFAFLITIKSVYH